MLQNNRTLADYNIQKEYTIDVSKLNFEGKIFEKAGLGCVCCNNPDLFGFISSKTGIPREDLYLINDSEIILDKDFDIKKHYFNEYFFKINQQINKNKI